jgi:Holliday junction resolvasome RuvABC ATP-dependent DNA helicase subunit
MENQPKPNFPKGGTFFSGEKKPEMITDRNGKAIVIGNLIGDSNIQAIKAMEESLQHKGVVLVGNARAGKTALMEDITERLKSFSHVVSQTGFTIAEFNSASKAFKNLAPTAEEVLQNLKNRK